MTDSLLPTGGPVCAYWSSTADVFVGLAIYESLLLEKEGVGSNTYAANAEKRARNLWDAYKHRSIVDWRAVLRELESWPKVWRFRGDFHAHLIQQLILKASTTPSAVHKGFVGPNGLEIPVPSAAQIELALAALVMEAFVREAAPEATRILHRHHVLVTMGEMGEQTLTDIIKTTTRSNYQSRQFKLTPDVPLMIRAAEKTELRWEDLKLGADISTESSSAEVLHGRYRGDLVVVKILSNNHSRSRRLFDTELAALATLSPHSNIVRMIGYVPRPMYRGLERAGAIIFQPAGGCTLGTALASDKVRCNRTPQQVAPLKLDLCRQIASGLRHLHENAISHGDLAPRNTMWMDCDGNIRLTIIDFGLALKRSRSGVVTGRTEVDISRKAPEFWLDGTISKAGDVYSVGILFWELLTEASWDDCVSAISDDDLETIVTDETNPDRHPDLASIVGDFERALLGNMFAFDRSVRPSIEDVHDMLLAEWAKRSANAF